MLTLSLNSWNFGWKLGIVNWNHRYRKAKIDCLSLFMCPLLAQLKIGFFSSFSAAAVYSTNETNRAGLKQSIIFRCLWLKQTMEQHTLKNVNNCLNTNLLLLRFIWWSKFESIFKCCSFFQHQSYLEICGSLRQLFFCIGVYYVLFHCLFKRVLFEIFVFFTDWNKINSQFSSFLVTELKDINESHRLKQIIDI